MNSIQELQTRIEANRLAVDALIQQLHTDQYSESDRKAMREMINALNEQFVTMTRQPQAGFDYFFALGAEWLNENENDKD